MNEIIEKELSNFILNLEMRSIAEKKLFHYQSVLNLSNGLMELGNSSSKSFKELLITYFKSVNDLNYLIDKEKSSALYKNHLLPIGRHLIEKKNFGSNGDIIKYILLGFILDSIMYYFFKTYFLFSIVLIFIGYFRRKKKKEEKKYISLYW